jgi:hypothetical protein
VVSAWARFETRTIVTVIAMKATPVLIAEYPRTSCRYSVIRKNCANAVAPIVSTAALAAESLRRRKIRSGSSGADERASIPTNATINAPAVASKPTVTPSLQPCWLVRVIA